MSLEDLALNARLLAAGFAGGVVHVFATAQKDPYKIMGSIVCGLFVSNYLGAPAAHYLKGITGEQITEPGAGFVIGFCAMAIVGRTLKWASRAKMPPTSGNGDGDTNSQETPA